MALLVRKISLLPKMTLNCEYGNSEFQSWYNKTEVRRNNGNKEHVGLQYFANIMRRNDTSNKRFLCISTGIMCKSRIL